MKQIILMGMFALGLLSSCNKDDDTLAPVADGIQVNPVIPYQEAYPGSMVTFKVGVFSQEPVTTFGVRFKFPGTTDFVSLPEYPDTTKPAEFTSTFGTFEYALPPALTAVDTTMKFKFIASSAKTTYETEYAVKMKSIGNQRLRLYSPAASGYFKFTALDLLKSTGAPLSFPALTKDIIVDTVTAKNTVTGISYNVIIGWKSANGTKFKIATAAQYTAAPSTYAAAYTSIAVANELVGVSTLGATSSTINGVVTNIGLLVTNNYYIAKVNRNGVFSYVAINVKTSPLTLSSSLASTSAVNLTKEYIEIEIKK